MQVRSNVQSRAIWRTVPSSPVRLAALVKKRGTAKELIAELMAEAEALGALDLAAMAELNARQGRCLEDADA